METFKCSQFNEATSQANLYEGNHLENSCDVETSIRKSADESEAVARSRHCFFPTRPKYFTIFLDPRSLAVA